MFKKYVVLNVLSHKTPCEIIILSCNGCVIKKVKIQSRHSKICFCTKDNCIKVLARYCYQVFYKNVSLYNLPCQTAFVELNFTTVFSNRSINLITLTDLNYGFPVLKALLYFKK